MTKKIDLTKLNARQKRAVQYGFKNGPARNTKPLLVIAGAGTGKTNILAHRVAYMIELELIAPRTSPFRGREEAWLEANRRDRDA
jgi:UvrD/REP helicase N-terminal domain